MKSKGLVLVVVFSLLICSVDLTAKERRGTELVIQKLDGQQIKGELIAVKQNSLLLLSPEGADVSVDIKEINAIKVVKKPQLLMGAGVGLLVGVGFGTIIGGSGKEWIIVGGIGGLILGLASVSIDFLLGNAGKTIQIKGKPDTETKAVLEKLRRQARITNAQ